MLPETSSLPIDPALAQSSAIPWMGILVLMSIPIVAFALWGDYFERNIQNLKKEGAKFDETGELYRIRLNSLFAILAEVAIFLRSGYNRADSNQNGALFCLGLALASTLSLLLLATRFEHSLLGRENPSTPLQTAKSAFKATAWSILAGVTYLVAFGVTMVLCTLPAAFFKVSATAAILLLMTGITAGVTVGLSASFALAPFFVRKIFGAVRIGDPALIAQLDVIFSGTGGSSPRYWALENRQSHAAGAMVAGFSAGRGIFRPGLFISKSILEILTASELRSVILHEVSHLELKHLKKRFLFSSGLVICSSLITGIFVQVAQAVFTQTQIGGLAGCIALFLSFSVALKSLGNQTRYQEIQADIHSIENLGSRLTDLASALRKLDRHNGVTPPGADASATALKRLSLSGHPETELRIRILEKYFESKLLKKTAPCPSGDEGPSQRSA